MSIEPSLLNVRWQSSLVWKSSVSFQLFMQGFRVSLAAFKFMKDPVKWSSHHGSCIWELISEILQLACMSSMCRFRFDQFCVRLGIHSNSSRKSSVSGGARAQYRRLHQKVVRMKNKATTRKITKYSIRKLTVRVGPVAIRAFLFGVSTLSVDRSSQWS